MNWRKQIAEMYPDDCKLSNEINFVIYVIIIGFFLFVLSGCTDILRGKSTDIDSLVRQQNLQMSSEQPALRKSGPDHLELAKQLIAGRYYDVALTQLKKVHKVHGKKQADVYYLTGVCLRETGRLRQAVALFEKAVKLDPDYSPGYNGIGLCYEIMGKTKCGIKYFKTAIEKNPAIADYYNNLAYAEILEHKFDSAKKHLINALDLDPGHGSALNNMALCMVMTNNEHKAFGILKKHYPLPEVYNNLGVMLYLKGNMDSAAAMYKKALEIDPNYSMASKNMNLIKEKLKK